MPTQADNDRYARSQGFKNAAQMLAFYQRQRERTAAPAAPSIGNFLSQPFGDIMKQGMAWHPKVTLEYVADKMRAATQ